MESFVVKMVNSHKLLHSTIPVGEKEKHMLPKQRVKKYILLEEWCPVSVKISKIVHLSSSIQSLKFLEPSHPFTFLKEIATWKPRTDRGNEPNEPITEPDWFDWINQSDPSQSVSHEAWHLKAMAAPRCQDADDIGSKQLEFAGFTSVIFDKMHVVNLSHLQHS